MEFVKNAINWFEIPVSDFDRAKKFYETIFDFEMPVMEMGDSKMGFLLYNQQEEGVGGCICSGEGYTPAGHGGVKTYLNGGSDLQIVLNRVAPAGGSVTMEKTQITPEFGYMGFFQDTEGNVLGLHSMA